MSCLQISVQHYLATTTELHDLYFARRKDNLHRYQNYSSAGYRINWRDGC